MQLILVHNVSKPVGPIDYYRSYMLALAMAEKKPSFKRKLMKKINQFNRYGGIDLDDPVTYKRVLSFYKQHPFDFYTHEKLNLKDVDAIELDHIVPKSKGGSNKLVNLAITSKQINRMKGPLLLSEFLAQCVLVAKLEPTAGIEPATTCLQNTGSTAELCRH